MTEMKRILVRRSTDPYEAILLPTRLPPASQMLLPQAVAHTFAQTINEGLGGWKPSLETIQEEEDEGIAAV